MPLLYVAAVSTVCSVCDSWRCLWLQCCVARQAVIFW